MHKATKLYLTIIAILAISFTISLLFNHFNAWVGFFSYLLLLGIIITKGKDILEWILNDSKPKKQNTKTKNKKSKNEKL